MEEMKNCLTCEYWECSAFGPECTPCKYTDDGMTGWKPANKEKEKEVKKEVKKALSEYTVEEIEAELKRRQEQMSEDIKRIAWIDHFVVGDYYKISIAAAPDKFVIIRADKKVLPAHSDDPYVECTNVYDNHMCWISKPFIHAKTFMTSKYTVEHLVTGYSSEGKM